MSDRPFEALPPAASLGYLVNHLARQFTRALHQRIGPHGVVPGQFAQLLVLYERGPMTQQELVAIVQIEQPTMAATLKRMERDGLITRRPDPQDGRRSLIELTEHARSLEPLLVAAAREVNEFALDGLGIEDGRRLLAVLARVVDNLDAHATPQR